MRKYYWLMIALLALAMLAVVGCGDMDLSKPAPTLEPEAAIRVIGIDVSGQESDIYDPEIPEATFPPENIISGSYETPAPGITQKPNQTPRPTQSPKPTATPDWQGDNWEGDSQVVPGEDLM